MRANLHKFCWALCLWFFFGLHGYSQEGNWAYLEVLQMNRALDPPENILSSKSLVLISIPEGEASGAWKEKAEEVQAFFAEEAIDAVAYFNLDRQFAFPGVPLALPKSITDRKISNLIFLTIDPETEEFVFGIGPFNQKNSFYDKGTVFWTRKGKSLEGVFQELSSRFATGAFAKSNLLVNDSPESFNFITPNFAARYASMPPDLAKKKIAVPLIHPPSDQAGGALLNSVNFYHADQVKTETVFKNSSIRQALADSTLTMELVDLRAKNEAQLRKEGFTHVLYHMITDSEDMYRTLPYKKREEVAAPVLVKFFLKDLRNRNLFLGRYWDANANWDQAFGAFMAQLEKEIVDQAN